MESMSGSMIRDLVNPTAETISPEETVMTARRRMESQAIRSLLVVEGDRPIGLVSWRGLGQEDGSAQIRQVMQAGIPALTDSMSIDDAATMLAGSDVDFDQLPVVDDSGVLIGEVPRTAIMKRGVEADAATRPLQSMSAADEATSAPAIHIEQGMNVVGADDDKLGSVDQVEVSAEGTIAAFTVKHGLLGRHAKRLPVDVIVGTRGDDLLVTIGQTEFKMLADVGDEVV